MDTWVGDKLITKTTGFYHGPDLATPSASLTTISYGYGTKGTSVDRPAARAHELRRSANGRIVIPRHGTSPIQVEWTALDGRRQNLAVAPEADGTISVATPRGVGILRVTQDSRTKVHPIANF